MKIVFGNLKKLQIPIKSLAKYIRKLKMFGQHILTNKKEKEHYIPKIVHGHKNKPLWTESTIVFSKTESLTLFDDEV